MPRWSDDEEAASATPADVGDGGVGAANNARSAAPESGGKAAATSSATSDAGPRTCAWCATPAAEEATRCASCGAALAQRESIGDLVVPGLTAVDPALKDLDGRPLRLAGPSPSHGVASGAIVAAAAGGPLGLAILGGVGAVAAVEYLGASRGRPGQKGHDNVGETSDAVRQAVERLDRGEALPTASETPEAAASAQDGAAQSGRHDDGNPGGE